MNCSKIFLFLITLFHIQTLWSMETDGNTATVDETEGALVAYTPPSHVRKRKMQRIGDGSFAEVCIPTKQMVKRGLLTVKIPFSEMDLSDFSVLKERIARGLLRVDISPARGPFVEPDDVLRSLIGGYLKVASMYYHGGRVAENKGASLYHFFGAARKGCSSGPFYAAWMLHVGDGVPADKVSAANLYALASSRGHPVASYNLGGMLVNNEVGESYPGERIQCAIFFARRGVPQAQELLWRMGIPWEVRLLTATTTAPQGLLSDTAP